MKGLKFLNALMIVLGLSCSAFTFANNSPTASAIPTDFDLAKIPKKQKPLLGQTITIDTRKPQTCREIREALDPNHSNRQFDDLCTPDAERPYSTLVIVNPPTVEASGTPRVFNEDMVIHANNARNVMIMGVMVVGRFVANGIEASNWNKPENGLREAWHDHVTKAPVIDKDDFRTNFIEHPISGSVYYTIARHAGYSAWESFGFAAFSSTFLWEYGLEAIFERPSINDMIVTPVLGSLLGEVFYQIFNRIVENDGKLLGSKKIGLFVQVITNPGFFMSAALNTALGAEWFKEGDIGWVVRNNANRVGLVPLRSEDYSKEIALRLRLKF